MRCLSPTRILPPMAIGVQDFTLNFQVCSSPQLWQLENTNPQKLIVSICLNYFSVLDKRVPRCSRCRYTLYEKRTTYTVAFSKISWGAALDGALPCSPGDRASCWSPQGTPALPSRGTSQPPEVLGLHPAFSILPCAVSVHTPHSARCPSYVFHHQESREDAMKAHGSPMLSFPTRVRELRFLKSQLC